MGCNLRHSDSLEPILELNWYVRNILASLMDTKKWNMVKNPIIGNLYLTKKVIHATNLR